MGTVTQFPMKNGRTGKEDDNSKEYRQKGPVKTVKTGRSRCDRSWRRRSLEEGSRQAFCMLTRSGLVTEPSAWVLVILTKAGGRSGDFRELQRECRSEDQQCKTPCWSSSHVVDVAGKIWE